MAKWRQYHDDEMVVPDKTTKDWLGLKQRRYLSTAKYKCRSQNEESKQKKGDRTGVRTESQDIDFKEERNRLGKGGNRLTNSQKKKQSLSKGTCV